MSISSLNVESYMRGGSGYEQARLSAVWNGRVPERYPELILRPRNAEEVAEAVRYAASRDMKIGVRSGGHSWSASYLRDGGLLLDLRYLNELAVDPDSATAQVGPAVLGGDLAAALAPHGLMFTGGHLPSVGLGGYLLQGGFGWNSRKLGLGCENVTSVEVVTADGELVRADLDEHPDLFWAARGGGPGFFGVAVKFWLRVHPSPASMTSGYVFPVGALDDLLRWADDAQPSLPRHLETAIVTSRNDAGELTVRLTGDALGDTREESREALTALDEIATSIGSAIQHRTFVPITVPELLQRNTRGYPTGARYEADNVWTDAKSEQLLPQIHRIVEALPPAPSHFFIQLWGPPREVPDMAFSMQGRMWMTCYFAGWDPAGDDGRGRAVTRAMQSLEPAAHGIQLGDENLRRRPYAFMAPANYARLQDIKAWYDPDDRFHSYLGVPAEWRS